MSKGKENLQTGVRTLLSPALHFPADLVVKVANHGRDFNVVVSVHPADMPRLIGAGGNNVRAVKGMLAHVGKRNGCFISFFAADPEESTLDRYVTPPAARWDPRPIMKVATTALRMANYPERITGPVTLEGKHFIACSVEVDQTFFENLGRWLHVCGRATGGFVVLQDARAAV